MKKKILLIFLCVISLLGITGCEKKGKENSLNDLVDIKKIYYIENVDDSISMYLAYSVSSDKEKDITVGSSASLKTESETKSSSFYTYDINKSIIGDAGFPTVVEFKTLYAGSDEKLKYMATFTINKDYLENEKSLILQVPINGTVNSNSPDTEYEYLEKKFTLKKINSFKYVENSEFVKEFEKDYK